MGCDWRAHLEYLIRIASGDGTFKVKMTSW